MTRSSIARTLHSVVKDRPLRLGVLAYVLTLWGGHHALGPDVGVLIVPWWIIAVIVAFVFTMVATFFERHVLTSHSCSRSQFFRPASHLVSSSLSDEDHVQDELTSMRLHERATSDEDAQVDIEVLDEVRNVVLDVENARESDDVEPIEVNSPSQTRTSHNVMPANDASTLDDHFLNVDASGDGNDARDRLDGENNRTDETEATFTLAAPVGAPGLDYIIEYLHEAKQVVAEMERAIQEKEPLDPVVAAE